MRTGHVLKRIVDVATTKIDIFKQITTVCTWDNKKPKLLLLPQR